jgi:diguanylate cyclase (GGDEF)-like protein
VVTVVVAVLTLQVVAAAVIGLTATSGARDVATDAAVFSGDATALHVRETRSVVAESLLELERFVVVDGQSLADHDTLGEQMIRLLRHNGDLSGVGLANDVGDAVIATRSPDGLSVTWFPASGVPAASRYSFDGVALGDGPSLPDPGGRLLPWVTAGLESTGIQWHAPYVPPTGPRASVDATLTGTHDGDRYVAVVFTQAPELDRAVWDSPGSDVGDVWLLTGDGAILAAPPQDRQWLADIVSTERRVPMAAEAGLVVPTTVHDDGYGTLGGAGTVIAYERPVWGDAAEDDSPPAFSVSDDAAVAETAVDMGADWRVHVEVGVDSVSPAASIIQRTLVAYALVIAAVVAASAFALWRLRGPISDVVQRSRTDALTGVANRFEFTAKGSTMMDSAKRRNARVLVLAIDLDHFKSVNDTQGHDAGDKALANVGGALRLVAGPRDVVGRLGGDEFAVLRWLDDGEDPAAIAEQIREAAHAALATSATPDAPVGASAGFSIAHQGNYRLSRLLTAADDALVGGRGAGKGTVYAADAAIQ